MQSNATFEAEPADLTLQLGPHVPFTDEHEHSYLSDAEYPALMEALLAWVSKGEKPTPQRVAERCAALLASYGGACHFMPDYRPPPLSERVTPR